MAKLSPKNKEALTANIAALIREYLMHVLLIELTIDHWFEKISSQSSNHAVDLERLPEKSGESVRGKQKISVTMSETGAQMTCKGIQTGRLKRQERGQTREVKALKEGRQKNVGRVAGKEAEKKRKKSVRKGAEREQQ